MVVITKRENVCGVEEGETERRSGNEHARRRERQRRRNHFCVNKQSQENKEKDREGMFVCVLVL